MQDTTVEGAQKNARGTAARIVSCEENKNLALLPVTLVKAFLVLGTEFPGNLVWLFAAAKCTGLVPRPFSWT